MEGGLYERNNEIVERARKYQADELEQEFREKTLGVVKKGWITELFPIDEHALRNVPPTPRFAVKGANGGTARKVRLVDDFAQAESVTWHTRRTRTYRAT